MTYPEEKWNYSEETEVVRLLQTAYSIKNNFYLKSGFFVLPQVLPNNSKIVYFPRLTYPAHFWETVKSNTVVLTETNNPVISELKTILPPPNSQYQKLKEDWDQVKEKFWNQFAVILPNYFEGIKTLEIRPTLYGTIATGYSNWLEDKGKIIIYVRLDADCSHIVEAILLDRFRKFKESNQYTWEEREAIIDFLITETNLSKLFPDYKPTLESIRHMQQAHLAKESQEYLDSYGFRNKQIFELREGKIYVNGTLFNLTDSEHYALRLMIEKRRSPVSYDEFADILWGKEVDEKFSLAAITKLIERLRKKIEEQGIFPSIIQTSKGYGYMLVD